jgi:hypothetical protein
LEGISGDLNLNEDGSNKDAFETKDSFAQLLLISSLNITNEKLTSSCNSDKAIWDKLAST